MDTNLSYVTLEGPGPQMVDTRSTSLVALKTLGYNVPKNFDGNFLGLLSTEYLRTQDSENVVGLGAQASVSKLQPLKVRS